MRLVHRQQDRFEFEFRPQEKKAFCAVLDAYPLIPGDHHRLTRSPVAAVTDADQELLRDSMASAKAEGRRRLNQFLSDGDRFVRRAESYRVRLTREELEWLLRVLNDVRVGSWLRLGCPDPEKDPEPEPTPETARFLLLMEMAGSFEYALLVSLDGEGGAGWGTAIR